ncbi:MAG: histidinol-phosphate transaminase [Kofleriaceae bacterium]|jgi:histidinol-phosphate aminotransferase|nr:histidinol-phosphate transaminase [Kofleriaceae bacterium]MBP9170513.1 histidinol-phosphate transaminase [Kofleriaceae bacterium]MBP9860846.1 histidinol-phosphate transaminase [Kofleriaceae bacterium]
MDASEMARFAARTPPHVGQLDAYQPGKPIEELERELGITGAIKVASNENPLGPSPKALAAIAAALPTVSLYPDAAGHALRRALAAHHGVAVEALALGAGSNDLLYQLVLALVDRDEEIVTPALGFLSYRLAAAVAGRRFVTTPATPRGPDIDALAGGLGHRAKLVILGTPNNPTGAVLTRAEVERVLAAAPADALIVLDEAYCEYAAAWPEVDHVDGLELVRADPRVIVLRTFSKIYGLAALRVGYAIAHPSVIDALGRVVRTFHVGTLAQVAATAALGDGEHVAASAALGRRAVERLRAEVHGPGVVAYPSLANFVLFETGRPSQPLYEALLKRGVIVRPMAAWGLPTCLRVSVAADAELDRVIGTLCDVLA